MRMLLMLLVACGGELSPGTVLNRDGALVNLDAARAGVGARCAVDVDCTAGLSCTPLISAVASDCELAWVDFRLAVCPDGWQELTTAEAPIGTVNLGNLTVTGYWCVPTCVTWAGCSNEQCCLGGSFGICQTLNPASQYLVPMSCPS